MESLYSVIEKVGLEIASITLEPIAAINIAIKEELRLLNLALIDYIDFDLSKPRGKLVLTVNDKEVGYMSRLQDGDDIKIYWK